MSFLKDVIDTELVVSWLIGCVVGTIVVVIWLV